MDYREICCLSVEDLVEELENKRLSFKNIIDAYHDVDENESNLYKLLQSEELINKALQKNLLNDADTQYLLNKIQTILELELLSTKSHFIKHLYEHCILKKEHINKYNALMLTNSKLFCYKKFDNAVVITDFFDLVEFYSKRHHNQTVLNLNDAYRNIHKFNLYEFEQLSFKAKQNLIELFDDNKQALSIVKMLVDFNFLTFDSIKKVMKLCLHNREALNALKNIFENRLESTFNDFDALFMCLKQKTKKHRVEKV